MKILLSFVCFMLFAGIALGQTPTPTPTGYSDSDTVPDRPSTKPVTAAELQARIKAAPDAKKFIFEYDKFKDQTWLTTHVKFRYPKAKVAWLKCEVTAVTPGQDFEKEPAEFILVFIPEYGTREWQFLDRHDLIFLLDGKRLAIGEGDHDGDVRRGGVNESVTFVIDRRELEEMANATKIEIQLGDFEGEIEKDGQPRLKTILALLRPPKQ